MKIALLGATGNIGSHTLRAAAGHQIVAYARRPEAVEGLPGVSVTGGELDDMTDLSQALAGADVLIVAITGPVKDRTFASRTLPGILDAAKTAGVARVVYVSAFGVGESAGKASAFARLIYRTVLRGFFTDKATAEAQLAASDLAWTIVLPVNLKAAAEHPEWATVDLASVRAVPGLPTLPFGNVARSLLQIASDPSWTGKRVLLTTAKGWKPAR
ncbi:hypothetical protein BHE97_18435 [Aeromicrobium sp. PE09-221]|uniref:NAD(P)-dependent oxidoreductase n=1 Tax=Aeromicrobium sp. PE09-221 TaxID=1898043 RepID=UPI000B3EA42B|nr:NAD(P)-binding oxidoreductase [Aeromicrobium sp. PE09-221]OUZ06765.1 hypothetical protein BHE97_18435 [Aeromicrobium sp. PE09-221]